MCVAGGRKCDLTPRVDFTLRGGRKWQHWSLSERYLVPRPETRRRERCRPSGERTPLDGRLNACRLPSYRAGAASNRALNV